MNWTAAAYEQYQRDGFYIQRGLLKTEELDLIQGQIDMLVQGDDAVDGMHREREKSGAVRQIYAAHEQNETFADVVRNPSILNPVQHIIGNDVYIWHSKINVKDAFEGTVWLWHQDYGYWMYDGVQPQMMSVMVFLDQSTINNGCLMGIAGSHKWGRIEHYSDEVTTSYKQWCVTPGELKSRVREEDITHLTGNPGDVLFFDCNLVHGSSHNMSPLPRKTFIICYNSIANKPIAVENPRPDWVVSRHFEVVS